MTARSARGRAAQKRWESLCTSYEKARQAISHSYEAAVIWFDTRAFILAVKPLLSNSLGIPLTMRNQIHDWLAEDWIVLGTQVQHRLVVIAAIALVALLVAWFERPNRTPGRPSSRLPRTIKSARTKPTAGLRRAA